MKSLPEVDVDWREQHNRGETSEVLCALACKLGVVGSHFYYGRLFSFILFYDTRILHSYLKYVKWLHHYCSLHIFILNDIYIFKALIAL